MLFIFVTVWWISELEFVTGQYSLTGSPNPAVIGSTVTFTCTTSPAQTAVQWTETINPTSAGSTEFPYSYYPSNGRCERSNGDPPADYTFLCNTAGVYTVRFPVDYSRHKGSIWKCGDAFGNTGESSSITLNVHVPLTHVTLLNATSSPLTVNQGTSVSLVCVTNPTDPVSTITWRRDSQTVSQGVTSSTRSETQGEVVISAWTKSVQWEDRGGYSCLASWNSAAVTKTSQTLSLIVQVPVSAVTLTNITNTNQDISITEDSILVLSCLTSPAPTVMWYVKGSQTSSGVVSQTDTQTNGQVIMVSTITRTVRRNNDRDTYSCRAGGKQSLTASVNVYYGPDTGQLTLTKPSVIAERNPLILTCRTQAAVNPEVIFSWSYQDNTHITSGIGNKQGSVRNTWSQTLSVTPVRDSNRQVVRCKVNNTETNVGETVQTTVDLDVNYGPDVGEVTVNKAATAIESNPLTMTCSTTNNVKPDVTFTWSIDGSEVTSGTGTKQGTSGRPWSQTLTFTPSRDQRSVGCTVSNSLISRQESTSVVLDVSYPPDISMGPVEGTENTDLTLSCTASGNPPIYQFEDFTQYWGGQLIQRRPGNQIGDRYDLTLSRVTYQDSGVYVCTVGNNVKQPSHSNTTMNVMSSPVFSKESVRNKWVSAEVNQTVTLYQYIYCSPNCTSISWNFTNGNKNTMLAQAASDVSSRTVHLGVYGVEVVEQGYRMSYKISNLHQNDVGIYTATVCNSAGCSASSVNLIVSGPPEIPALFKVLASTADSVFLTWVPRYTGGDYLQEFHVEYREQSSNDDWMVKIFPDSKETIMSGAVDGLTPDTLYVFRVKSVSKRKTGSNESPFSREITKATQAKELQPTSSSSPSHQGLGAGIGIGVGISAIVVAVGFAVFCILRRRKAFDCPSKDRIKGQTSSVEMQTSDGSTGEPALHPSDYTQLQQSTSPNTYERIDGHHYQNTEAGAERSLYESLDAGPPQKYESLPARLYVNDARQSEDQTYANSTFTTD